MLFTLPVEIAIASFCLVVLRADLSRSIYFFLSIKLIGSSLGSGVGIKSNSLLSKKISNLSIHVSL
jgi:hypothetical protein|tara:strand:+ start:89 stop:286 length:198 start_codon:yes stop_codon:yes gene_type:complete